MKGIICQQKFSDHTWVRSKMWLVFYCQLGIFSSSLRFLEGILDTILIKLN